MVESEIWWRFESSTCIIGRVSSCSPSLTSVAFVGKAQSSELQLLYGLLCRRSSRGRRHASVMKTCAKCKHPKRVAAFGWRSIKLGTRDAYCRPCRRKYNRDHYKQNKSAYFERNKRALLRLAAFVDSLKDKPCQDCGNVFPPCAMDFDHRVGEVKIASLSQFAKGLVSKRLILAEVAKCDLVCATCHRIRTCERDHKHKHRPRRLHGEAPHS